ncbi:MAG TPA: VOC family protein [Gaiellaceae bacterium]
MTTLTAQAREAGAVLADSEVVSLIVYVDDLDRSRAFYEGTLGLRSAADDGESVTYDTGPVRLWLRRAADDGIVLARGADDSCTIVFLVDDAVAARAALGHRGLADSRQCTYSVGRNVDFYDPDGHRLMVYQPSESALETPVAGNLRDLWRTAGKGGAELIGPPAAPLGRPLEDVGIDGKPLLYLWVFIRDLAEGATFFERQLGLRVLDQGHCCSDVCPDDLPGVVKYDGGDVILATHHMHGHESLLDDDGRPHAARDYDPKFAQGVAPALRVSGIEDVIGELAARGVSFRNGVLRRRAGALAGFLAPSGHLFYLFEPAPVEP